MKKIKGKICGIIGVILIIAGALGGLYVGGWRMFIQPIIEVCKAFDAGTITGMMIGLTVIKCIFASGVGSLIFIVGYYLGMFFIFAA